MLLVRKLGSLLASSSGPVFTVTVFTPTKKTDGPGLRFFGPHIFLFTSYLVCNCYYLNVFHCHLSFMDPTRVRAKELPATAVRLFHCIKSP